MFVETVAPDPDLVVPSAWAKMLPDLATITVLRVQFPSRRWGEAAFVDRERRRLVQEALRGPLSGQFKNPVQWFYDPMAVTAFAGRMNEIATVYDCMDELSQFRFAPPEIKQRELDLLARADVVFTGGRRLFDAKRKHHPNCHFYGCGVDVAHFGSARLAETVIPEDLASLQKPILGYFGVIDERIDYELIARLADANPRWSVAMVGPVIKVEENALPRRPNLHWLGRREYRELPACAKAFDVCLMPFALNEATEYINPTKSLEYMATGRPIVSSAIPDVVANFSEVVKLAATHDEFISLCRASVAGADDAAIERGLALAAANSWDSIVAQLENHIRAVLNKASGTRQEPKALKAHEYV